MAGVTIKGTTQSGKSISFKKVLSFKLQSDRFTPVDSFEFTALDDISGKNITHIYFYLDGKLLFEGYADVQKMHQGEDGKYCKFVCRNKYAGMIDNEVKPCYYYNLNSYNLLCTHAFPYGVKGANLDRNLGLRRILAKKGISHWEFVTLFFKIAYQKIPFIDRNGRLSLTPLESVSHTFSNTSKGGVKYTDASVTYDRFNLISKLFVKTGKDDDGATYNYIISNVLARNLGVSRERYLNPSSEWVDSIDVSAKSLLCEKQLDYFELELTVPKLFDAHVGDRCVFKGELGNYSNLYVAQTKLICDENSYKTKLKLWDSNMITGG